MAAKYVVVDADGLISWSAKTDGPEVFGSLTAATKRAKELAERDPGRAVLVYQSHSVVIARVHDAEVSAY